MIASLFDRSISESARVTYAIHVTNLPPSVTAEIVSQTLGYSILDIVMFAPSSSPNSPLECWLKRIETEAEAKDIAESWDGQLDFGRKIQCEVEEEQVELCPYFRLGMCQYDEDCLWAHVSCTAEKNCSQSCPYGHERGMKTGFNRGRLERQWEVTDTLFGYFYSLDQKDNYYIKITGFPDNCTPEMLCKILKYPNVTKCRTVYSGSAPTAHINYLKPYKVANNLLSQWKNDTSNEATLRYEFELYRHRPFANTQWNSPSRVHNNEEDNDSRQPRRSTSLRPDHGTRFRGDSSNSRETSTSKPSDAQQPSRRFGESNTNELKPRDNQSKLIQRKSRVPYQYDKSEFIIFNSID